jgi:glycine cleavage system H protein
VRHVQEQVKEGVIIGAFTLALVVGLPILGALAFTMRGALLAIVVVVLAGGGAVYIFSRSFRGWVAAQTEPQIEYKGLRLSTDVAFHPSHSWARMDDTVVVGVDDVIQATLGPVEEVNLPPRGRQVRRGDQLFRLRREDRTIGVRAPVSGTVLAGNETLHSHPELINEEPFARGWAVRLRGDDVREDRRLLMRGKRARNWFHAEVDHIIGVLLADRSTAPVLPDGGVLVDQVHRHIDDVAWSRLKETMFARKQPETDTRS